MSPTARQFGHDSLGRQFGDNHKVKIGKKRSKTNGVKLSKMASGLWVSLRYFPDELFETLTAVNGATRKNEFFNSKSLSSTLMLKNDTMGEHKLLVPGVAQHRFNTLF